VEKIVKTAADLYDKVVGFTDTFENIGEQIEKVNKSFEKAKGQLFTGKGNVLGRVEKLKEMGVNPKRSRKALPDEEE
jgi:DNA recombination protein RmuC